MRVELEQDLEFHSYGGISKRCIMTGPRSTAKIDQTVVSDSQNEFFNDITLMYIPLRLPLYNKVTCIFFGTDMIAARFI